jgi:hypothetical protein
MIGRLGASLFGFIGAGATLGQLVGSLLAVGLARLGPGWISDLGFEVLVHVRCFVHVMLGVQY